MVNIRFFLNNRLDNSCLICHLQSDGLNSVGHAVFATVLQDNNKQKKNVLNVISSSIHLSSF